MFARGLAMTTIITDIPGIGPSTAKVLGENGFKTVEEIAGTTVEKLSKVPGFGAVRASAAIRAANGPLSTSRPRRATTAISRIRPIRKKVAPVKSDVKKKKLISEKQKKEKQRKEKQRKEKLRKEKQREAP
jgi:nucleotidyltransferase/DNA polymerase involved in DNA repair